MCQLCKILLKGILTSDVGLLLFLEFWYVV